LATGGTRFRYYVRTRKQQTQYVEKKGGWFSARYYPEKIIAIGIAIRENTGFPLIRQVKDLSNQKATLIDQTLIVIVFRGAKKRDIIG
jgi:hypothetical protein